MRPIWELFSEEIDAKIVVLYDYYTRTYKVYFIANEGTYRWQNEKGKDVWGMLGTASSVVDALADYMDNLQGLYYVTEEVKIPVPKYRKV